MTSSTSILPGSRPVYSDVLDSFSLLTTDVSSIGSETQIFNPIGNIQEIGIPVDIIAPSTKNLYTSLYESQVFVAFKITKKDGSNLEATDLISLNSNPFHSLFSEVEVFLNSTRVSSCCELSPYRGYLTNMLNYTPEQRAKDLSSQLFIKNQTEKLTKEDPAFAERATYIAGSKTVVLSGRLSDAIFQERKYIPSSVEIHLRLKKNDVGFIIEGKDVNASTEPYKIVFESIQFHVKRYLIHPEVVSLHNSFFNQGRKMIFPLNLVSIKTFPIQMNSNGAISSNLYAGSIPKALFVGVLPLEDFQGNAKSDAFFFKRQNVKNIRVIIDGESLNSQQLQIESDEKSLVAYNSLMSCLPEKSSGLGLSRSEFLNGNCLFYFNLLNSRSTATFSSNRFGSLKVLTFL